MSEALAESALWLILHSSAIPYAVFYVFGGGHPNNIYSAVFHEFGGHPPVMLSGLRK